MKSWSVDALSRKAVEMSFPNVASACRQSSLPLNRKTDVSGWLCLISSSVAFFTGVAFKTWTDRQTDIKTGLPNCETYKRLTEKRLTYAAFRGDNSIGSKVLNFQLFFHSFIFGCTVFKLFRKVGKLKEAHFCHVTKRPGSLHRQYFLKRLSNRRSSKSTNYLVPFHLYSNQFIMRNNYYIMVLGVITIHSKFLL